MKNAPPSFQLLRSFQGIDEYILPNGLKVLLFADPSSANVTVNITYLVGSRHEGRGEAGMAHLLEHMLFRGTHRLKDVKAALQDHGANFNGTTWYDRTNYYETMTPTDENLEFALKLESDRMLNSLILREDLDAEMTVVRNEFEMGENNPVHVLHDQIMSMAYRWHNYGKTTIGNRSDIERVPTHALRKFYEYYYQPDNAVLIVAGQFNRESAYNLIDKYFAVLPRPTRTLDATYTEEPAQDGPRELILERVGDMASVAAAYHIPALSHPDHASIKVLFQCLADEPSGILYEELVATGLCSEIFAMSYGLYEPGMAMCFVRPVKNDQAMNIRDRLINLLEHDACKTIDDVEVQRIKMRELKRVKQAMANSKDLALKLSEAIACGDWRLFFWYRDQISNVSLDDVKRVLKHYIIASNRSAGVFMPIKDPVRVAIDPAPPLDEVLSSVVEDQSIAMGEEFEASAENIEAHVIRKDIAPNKHLAMLAKKTRGQIVKAEFRFRFGNERALFPVVKEFWLIPSLLWRGTSKYSFQQIRDRVDGLMSTLDIDGYDGILIASIKSERAHFQEMIDLTLHMLMSSSFNPEEFAIVRQREIDNYEEVKSDPQRVGFQELERLKNPWPKDNIHYVHSFDEIIEGLRSLSLAHLKSAYQNLVSIDYCSVGLVGDFEPELVSEKLRAALCVQAKGEPFARITQPFIKNIATEVKLDCPDKEMAIIAEAFNFPMRDDHPDYVPLKMANYMFGEHMNSRLMNRIREREGISYGAGSSIEISRHEEHASLNIYAMAAPESISRARRAIEEEWSRLLSQGIEEKELETAKVSMWLSFQNVLGNDGYLVHALARDLEIGRDFWWRKQLYERVKNITCKEINHAMQQWWKGVEFSRVIACDLSKMK